MLVMFLEITSFQGKILVSFKSRRKILGERHSLPFKFGKEIGLQQGCFPSCEAMFLLGRLFFTWKNTH